MPGATIEALKLKAAANPGHCVLCARPLRKGARPTEYVCRRLRCRRDLGRRYQADHRRPSRLIPVKSVQQIFGAPRRRRVELECGCVLELPASRAGYAAARCPNHPEGMPQTT